VKRSPLAFGRSALPASFACSQKPEVIVSRLAARIAEIARKPLEDKAKKKLDSFS
jgi:hypothetical protein